MIYRSTSFFPFDIVRANAKNVRCLPVTAIHIRKSIFPFVLRSVAAYLRQNSFFLPRPTSTFPLRVPS